MLSMVNSLNNFAIFPPIFASTLISREFLETSHKYVTSWCVLAKDCVFTLKLYPFGGNLQKVNRGLRRSLPNTTP